MPFTAMGFSTASRLAHLMPVEIITVNRVDFDAAEPSARGRHQRFHATGLRKTTLDMTKGGLSLLL